MVSACLYRGHVALTGDFLEALPFRFESPFVHLKHQFSDYAQDCFFKDRPLLVAIQALMSKIYHEFTFDPEATHIGTPLLEVLEKKRGVCQDFAHLMLACLRSLGLPARYVSGYLLTNPPEGQARLIGGFLLIVQLQVGWTLTQRITSSLALSILRCHGDEILVMCRRCAV